MDATEAERTFAEILCRRNNLREQVRANLAPGVSEAKLQLAEIYLLREEKRRNAQPTL